MALHHNASNMHLSLAAPLLPITSAQTLTEDPFGFIDPIAIHVRWVAAVSTMWKPLWLACWCHLWNHRGLCLKDVRVQDVKLHWVSCLYPQYCGVNIHSREALWRLSCIGWEEEEVEEVLPYSHNASCTYVRVTLHLWGIYSALCHSFTSWAHFITYLR